VVSAVRVTELNERKVGRCDSVTRLEGLEFCLPQLPPAAPANPPPEFSTRRVLHLPVSNIHPTSLKSIGAFQLEFNEEKGGVRGVE